MYVLCVGRRKTSARLEVFLCARERPLAGTSLDHSGAIFRRSCFRRSVCRCGGNVGTPQAGMQWGIPCAHASHTPPACSHSRHDGSRASGAIVSCRSSSQPTQSARPTHVCPLSDIVHCPAISPSRIRCREPLLGADICKPPLPMLRCPKASEPRGWISSVVACTATRAPDI